MSAKKRKKKRVEPDAREAAPDTGASSAERLAHAKRILTAAAAILLVGLGLSAIGDLTFGPYVTVGALALGIFGAHKLGRAGRDPGIFTRA